MKTIVLALLILSATAFSFPIIVDVSTPHVVGTNTYYGDNLHDAFSSVNANATNVDIRITIIGANVAGISNLLITAVANANAISNNFMWNSNLVARMSYNFNTVSNNFSTVSNEYAMFMSTNVPGLTVVNSNNLDADTKAWLDGIGLSQALNGANLQSSTVNSNAFDTATMGWLQSCEVPGVLHDNGASTGSLGYIPVANGSGAWAWTQPDVIADTGGMGGTTLHLKASDTGADMYLHVSSLGVITVTGSP